MRKKVSILVVDDDRSARRTMSLVLRRKGYAVRTAKNGLQAVEEVKRRSFDVIFMDIKMPVMDGVNAYKEIKKIKPESLVIMMTAYAVEDLVQEALKEGARGVIYKPLDMEKVVALVEEARRLQ